MPGLVVTSSPAQSRTLNLIDAVDGNKLVRIYDAIKTKDLPAFTIPKHSLTSLNIVSAGAVDKLKLERAPKASVQAAQHLTTIYGTDATNWTGELTRLTKRI